MLALIEGDEIGNIQRPEPLLGQIDFAGRPLPANDNAALAVVELVCPVFLAVSAIDWKPTIRIAVGFVQGLAVLQLENLPERLFLPPVLHISAAMLFKTSALSASSAAISFMIS